MCAYVLSFCCHILSLFFFFYRIIVNKGEHNIILYGYACGGVG